MKARLYMAEILPIRRKTLHNQSINHIIHMNAYIKTHEKKWINEEFMSIDEHVQFLPDILK